MKLIVGLGNPGAEYEHTRHNTGFMFVDSLAKDKQVTFKIDTAFKGMIGSYIYNGEKIYLLKPITYMNLSGQAVSNVMNYYHINLEDILIIYDDMDLNPGEMRVRPGGASGGHNGIKNIMALCGSEKIKRIRIGIGHDTHNVIDYVLGGYSKEEANAIMPIIYQASQIIDDYCTISFDQMMSKYNTKAKKE